MNVMVMIGSHIGRQIIRNSIEFFKSVPHGRNSFLQQLNPDNSSVWEIYSRWKYNFSVFNRCREAHALKLLQKGHKDKTA